jgi:(R)-amidase
MIVELAQLPGVDGDIPANTASALQAIARCSPDTRLLVFPETYLSGFPTADNIAALAQPIDGPAISTIQQAAATRTSASPSALPRRMKAAFTTPPL